MSDITTMPFGAAEHCRLDNWAAEYAKKLFVAEAANRTEADSSLETNLKKYTDAAVEDEGKTRDEADVILNNKINNLSGTMTAADLAEQIARKAADDALGERIDSEQTARTLDVNTKIAKEVNDRNNAITAAVAGIETSKLIPLTKRVAACEAENENLAGEVSSIKDDMSWFSPGYHLKPTVSGEWVDMTPIWRVGIPLTAVQDISSCFINTAKADTYSVQLWDILKKLGFIKDTDKIILLSWKLLFKNGNGYNSDWFAAGVTEYPEGYWYIDQNFEENSDAATYFYGWVEFATERTNVITS